MRGDICRFGICGLGTVGSGVFNLVAANGEEITRKTGTSIKLVQVGCRRDHPDCDLSSVAVSRDIFDVARNPEVDVLVELIGGRDTAKDLVLEAISNSKHVVTANKALIALHGDELFAAAEKMGVQVRYEAAVAGSIPIVKAIREGLAANRIEWLVGIINGTSNFILTEMAREGNHQTFEQVLAGAQRSGYAEADPTFDVEGIDAAHKLTILASIAFGMPLKFAEVFTEGISALTLDDINFADELGYRIRHLGIARLRNAHRKQAEIELRVHPTLIPQAHLLAQVTGVMNAVMVGADAAGATMYHGAGAGAAPTASAVVADIIDIARDMARSTVPADGGNPPPHRGFTGEAVTAYRVLPIWEIESSTYLRLGVHDRAGVMAKVATILSNHNVSIEALLQKDTRGRDTQIVIVTNKVRESSINKAIDELESLDDVINSVSRIRIAEPMTE